MAAHNYRRPCGSVVPAAGATYHNRAHHPRYLQSDVKLKSSERGKRI